MPKLTDDDIAYLAKFYPIDGPVMLSAALDVHTNSIIKKYQRLQATRKLKHYIDMWDKQDVNRLERR